MAWPKCAKVNVVVRWADDGYYDDDDEDEDDFLYFPPQMTHDDDKKEGTEHCGGGKEGPERNQIKSSFRMKSHVIVTYPNPHTFGGGFPPTNDPPSALIQETKIEEMWRLEGQKKSPLPNENERPLGINPLK